MEGGNLKLPREKNNFPTNISEEIPLKFSMFSCTIDNLLFLS